MHSLWIRIKIKQVPIQYVTNKTYKAKKFVIVNITYIITKISNSPWLKNNDSQINIKQYEVFEKPGDIKVCFLTML